MPPFVRRAGLISLIWIVPLIGGCRTPAIDQIPSIAARSPATTDGGAGPRTATRGKELHASPARRPVRHVAAESDSVPTGPVFFRGERATSVVTEARSDDALETPADDSPQVEGRDEACEFTPDCRFDCFEDLCEVPRMLWDDTLACVSWPSAIVLGAAAGGAIAIREDLDGEVRAHAEKHRLLWGEGSVVLRQFGEFYYQVPAIFALYGWSVWSRDDQMYEFSKALVSAYTITAVSTVTIKGITDTRRPTDQFEDGRYGFPSFHTASTFTIAAVADEYYGWPVGLPCYILAGLVGFSRIDQREHDLSDVFFGSVLGFVIGKSVAAAHQDRLDGWRIVPCYDPATSFLGATFHKQF